MEEIIEKYIQWWRSCDKNLGKSLFHEDYRFRGCSQLASTLTWDDDNPADISDLRILKTFGSGKDGFILLEQTDELTGLYYRHAVYLKSKDGMIIEEIATKESVEKW